MPLNTWPLALYMIRRRDSFTPFLNDYPHRTSVLSQGSLYAAYNHRYAADMLQDPWQCVDHNDARWLTEIGAAELIPVEGKRQYVNRFHPSQDKPQGASGDESDGDDKSQGPEPNQMMLVSDMVLLWDKDFKVPALPAYRPYFLSGAPGTR